MIYWLHRVYRILFSPFLHLLFGGGGMGCRFVPTCGDYFFEALQVYGPIRGSVIGFRRVFRCHPFSHAGFDPLPARHKGRQQRG